MILIMGLISFIAYILVLVVTLVISKQKHEGYSIKSFWVSELGQNGSPNHKWFNVNVTAFGLLAFIFVTAFHSLLPNLFLSKLGVSFLYLTCLSTVLVGLFPMDTKPKAHWLTSIMIFTGINGSALFTIYPILVSMDVPNWTIIINLLILFSFPLLVFSKYLKVSKRKPFFYLVEFIVNHKGLWEWTACLSAISWDLIMSILTLERFINITP